MARLRIEGQRMRPRLLCIAALLLLCAGCAIPRRGGVFAVQPITGGGLVDRSSMYSGDYIRSTNQEKLVGLKGGSATHQHDISHVHAGTLTNGMPVLSPRGTENTAASG